MRALRDRIPAELAVHLGSQLPLLIRGTYYDQWHLRYEPESIRSHEEFVARVAEGLENVRPVSPTTAIQTVFAVVAEHVSPGQADKVRGALPRDIAALWPEPGRAADRTARAG